MRDNIWEQNFERAIDRLRDQGDITHLEATKLRNAYSMLRRCELVLRRHDNRSVSTLPGEPEEQRKLAIRLGYQDVDAFRRDYVGARDTIHALYNDHVTETAD